MVPVMRTEPCGTLDVTGADSDYYPLGSPPDESSDPVQHMSTY